MTGWLRSFLRAMGIFVSLVGLSIGIGFLTLRVLVPSKTIEVPSIAGKEIKEAAIILSEMDLALKIVDQEYSLQVPGGVIISQFPSPGTRVHKNRDIEVVVSEGRKVLSAPSLPGKRVREAKVYLSQRGLKFRDLSYVYAEVPRGVIIAQDPPAQTNINPREGISILVSLGKRNSHFYMPNFVGKRVEEVKDLLEKVPLKIGKIKESPSSNEEGVILSQSPLPGSRIDSETPIDLLVSAFYREKKPALSQISKWILISVRIPVGWVKRSVKVVVIDAQGKKILDYGQRNPGEEVWIGAVVVGKGEIRSYLDNALIRVDKVE
ncbi:MAG: PASTA domain-containing protein [bacterium]